MFENLKDDVLFLLKHKHVRIVGGCLAATGVLFGTGVIQAQPDPYHPPGMDFKPVGYYKVDASQYGMDGVFYRSHPDVTKSVKGLYPANGTIVYGKEPLQHPNWIIADNGYWLPLSVDGKPCVTKVEGR
eukprot:TRINITY_DN38740_c0_g1_i1.p1 TRINITY_DN38740_c0_g1~~TRINITY_DN38740_c0_g1_i1.p1  ORF type:complete len:148 (+),score=42.36 TRINITY_DN38740_c0_g1_i1:60-446(+)